MNNSQTAPMATNQKGDMKTCFIVIFLIVTANFALATTQISTGQDKPLRLYAKSYTDRETTVASQTWPADSSYYGWLAINHTDIFNVDDSDNPGGTGTQIGNYQDTDSSGNIHTYGYTNIYPMSFGGFGYWDSLKMSGSGIADGGAWQTTYSRTTSTVWHLQTGGKATSKQRNLFGFNLSVEQYNYAVGPYSSEYTVYVPSGQVVPPANIQIGSYGALNTNGTKYLILPDNADVDVTPQVSGVDACGYWYYPPQKYRSYFDLYVQQANPGYSLIFYSQTNDVGHAFWRFRTDAPADALKYISSSLTGFLGQKWGFYPMNGLFTVPGILQNDNSHPNNIQRTFCIGFPDLLQGLIYTRGISNAPPVYCLSSFNCVGAARGAGFAADVFGLPWDESPQNFGVTLIEMYPAPGQTIGPFIDTTDVFYSSAPY